MRSRSIALFCFCAVHAAAQLGGYAGPGIANYGAGTIGTQNGQDVNLRFYADTSFIYETGLLPYAVNYSNGNLVTLNGVTGEQAILSAYGVHGWENAQLGLDYRATFRHYDGYSALDGIDQQLALGYTARLSNRWYFDARVLGGTFGEGAAVEGISLPVTGIVNQPGSTIFDNRTSFGEGSVGMTYFLTARTSFTVGGEGFLARYQGAGLVGLNGYAFRGALRRRMTRWTTIGAEYEHLNFYYPGAYGNSSNNMYQGLLGTRLSRRWTLSLEAGVFQSEVQGIQQVAVNPVITALLGITNTTATFYASRIFPMGQASLTRQFHHASLSLQYVRSVSPGNGVYLASRAESGYATFGYTGSKRLSINGTLGAVAYRSVGQNLQTYLQAQGGAGLSYTLIRALRFTLRYDRRYEDIGSLFYNRFSYAVTAGFAFAPGPIPLNFH
jgi:hypothetical protein